jgi:hypothetical protein
MDTWNLIWIVVCSDTIIKFLLISLKAFVTLLPFTVVPLRKRVIKNLDHICEIHKLTFCFVIIQGNVYSAMENCALFYRSLTPIHPWLLFLMYSESVSLEKLLETTLDPTSKTGLLTDSSITTKALDNNNNASKAFPIFLCILYIIFKLNQMYNGFNDLLQSVQELLLDTVCFGYAFFIILIKTN